MLRLGSSLELPRGTVIHLDDALVREGYGPLPFLASMVITRSSLPWARVVRRSVLCLVPETTCPSVSCRGRRRRWTVAAVVRWRYRCRHVLLRRVGRHCWLIGRSPCRRRLVVLREPTFLESHLPLLKRVVRDHVVVIVNARVRPLALATSSSTKRVELSGKLRLRLDKRSTVVAHWLVTCIRVLREQSESRRDEDHEE
jgi:hypothetical protein